MNTEVLGGLLGFLIIGAIFYFIMRKGGCCGHSHSEHNQHGGHSHGESNTGKTKDPVCEMTIDEKDAAGTSEFNGKTYYFCAISCKQNFDKDPVAYIGSAQGSSQGHGKCC